MSSTASWTQRGSAGTRSSTETAAATPGAAGVRRTQRRSRVATSSSISEPRQGLVRRRRDMAEGVELAELAAQLADPPGQRHQRAEPGRIDVARLAAIDQEPPLAVVEALLHQGLELLAIAHDELTVDLDDRDAGSAGRLAESHRISSLKSPIGPPPAWPPPPSRSAPPPARPW